MGMYDYIKCEHPLPDGFDPVAHEWQTKDFYHLLETYRITADGQLIDPDGDPEPFHGDIEFYSSNLSGSYGDIVTTVDDSPPWQRCYVARFTEGKLSRIMGGLEEDHVRHVKRCDFDAAVAEERAKEAKR